MRLDLQVYMADQSKGNEQLGFVIDNRQKAAATAAAHSHASIPEGGGSGAPHLSAWEVIIEGLVWTARACMPHASKA